MSNDPRQYQQPGNQPPYQQPGNQPPYQQPYDPSQQQYDPYQKQQYPYQDPNLYAIKTKTGNLDNNVAGLLCYLPLFGIALVASLIFFFSEPKTNRFLRFHALQSLMLQAGGIIMGMVIGIGFSLISAFLGAGGSGAVGLMLICFLLMVLVVGAFGITLLILNIVGMIKAYKNQHWEMPIIGRYATQYLDKL